MKMVLGYWAIRCQTKNWGYLWCELFTVHLDCSQKTMPPNHLQCESGVECEDQHRSSEPTEHINEESLVGTPL
ncbi:hypothetical protein GGQ14_001005 [Salinibacter ruber]|jgi:hypothetical protein|nr:hypothetical protein [Salinibacter ruber]